MVEKSSTELAEDRPDVASFPQGKRRAALVQRPPDDVASVLAVVAMRRPIERAGQFPFLRFIAPLNRGGGDDVIGLAAGADRCQARRWPIDDSGRPGRFLVQVERIEKQRMF